MGVGCLLCRITIGKNNKSVVKKLWVYWETESAQDWNYWSSLACNRSKCFNHRQENWIAGVGCVISTETWWAKESPA